MGRRRKDKELNPDEIFLDSSNIPDFDTTRLEGRLEKPISERTFLGMLVVIVFVLLAYTVQAANLEIMQGEKYAEQSENNRLRPEILFAKRGAILDRNGEVLVENTSSDKGFISRSYRSPGFGHLLGYVSYPKKDSSGNYYDTEVKGLAGAEMAFEDQLAGENGLYLIEEDALGEIKSQGSVKAPVDGTPITLSIDARAQEAMHSSIAPSAFQSRKIVGLLGSYGFGMEIEPVETMTLSAEIILSLYAPAAIIGFTIEPGVYKPVIARSSDGSRELVK